MLIMRVWIRYDRVVAEDGYDSWVFIVLGLQGVMERRLCWGRITVAGVLDDLMRIGTLEDRDRDIEDLCWWVRMDVCCPNVGVEGVK